MRTTQALVLIVLLAVVFNQVDDGAARFSIMLAIAAAFFTGVSSQRTSTIVYRQTQVYLKDRRQEVEHEERNHELMRKLIDQGRREGDKQEREESVIILDTTLKPTGEETNVARAAGKL